MVRPCFVLSRPQHRHPIRNDQHACDAEGGSFPLNLACAIPSHMDKMTKPGIEPAQIAGPVARADGWQRTVALIGFILVATAQVSNMILARGLAGSVPPFALAFFRWTIIAAGLAPFAFAEIRDRRIPLAKNLWPIFAAGFLGMFLCGGPVYIAGISTTAIHIALIMALSPIVVLLL